MVRNTLETQDSKKAVVLLTIVAVAWGALGGFDWYQRVHRFRWDRTFRFRPPVEKSGLRDALQEYEVDAYRGGDLTRLVGLDSFTRKYGQPRPAVKEYTDEFGYRNIPPTADQVYPIVTVGDSYMDAGLRMEDIISARLSELSSLPVYNHAYTAGGPAMGLVRFYEAERFREHPPRVLVWGLLERETTGRSMLKMIAQIQKTARNEELGVVRSGIRWATFSPAELKRGLPNTSRLAQMGARIWRVVKYTVFHQLPSEVVLSSRPFNGKPLLFLGQSIEAAKWGPEQRRVDNVIFAIHHLNLRCRERGTTLVVLLIPDKVRIYRDYLPARYDRPQDPLLPSPLNDIERGLKEDGIRVVNLLKPFQERVSAGELLYWPDDTHWNENGIDVAARLVWKEIRDMFPRKPESL